MPIIRSLQIQDALPVLAIYQAGIDTGLATFETTAPDWATWHKKFLPQCRQVVVAHEKVMGWAALSPVSQRAVYAGVAEVSIYLAPEVRGQGWGGQLLQALIEASEAEGFWTLQASIFTENKASLRLHHKLGFRTVGYREAIAQWQGEWKDNFLLERRSEMFR